MPLEPLRQPGPVVARTVDDDTPDRRADDALEAHARRDGIRAIGKHLSVVRVADDQPVLGVVEARSLR